MICFNIDSAVNLGLNFLGYDLKIWVGIEMYC